MRNLSLLLLIGLVVLSACGVREQPLTGEVTPAPVASATSAPPGPSAPPAPDRTSGAVPVATPETTTTALPMITSQVVLAGRPAAPGTLLLRDAWDTRSPPDTVAQTLLYSFLDYDRRPASAPSAFYQLTLGDAPTKTEIVRIPNSGLEEPTYGYLSPDGQYIAYLVHLDGNRANLRMMRVDGSEDRFITDRVFIAGLSINCSTNVSWSPDSTRIAFHRYNPTAPTLDTQRQIGVYQINTSSEPTIVQEYRFSDLIGWKNDQELLVFNAEGVDQPLQLLELNLQTRANRVVQAHVSGGYIVCYKPAPDRRHALIQLLNGDLLIDLVSGQVQSTDISTRAAAWGPTGQDLLEHTPDVATDARLTNATQANLTQPLTFFPPDLGPAVTVLDTSPDGRYVVVCDGRWSETEGVVNRFLLYDSRQNLWFVVERGLYCPSIIGWLSHTDTVTR